MQTIHITKRRKYRDYKILQQVGDAQTLTADFRAWTKSAGNLDDVEFTVKSGSVSITDQSISDQIATCRINTEQQTRARVIMSATSVTGEKINITLLIRAIEPTSLPEWDYGYIIG